MYHRQRCSGRWLRNMPALMPCGKPQAAHFDHVTTLPPWLSWRVHINPLQALRRSTDAHPCAWVCAILPLRARSRGRPGTGASAGPVGAAGHGHELGVQERSRALGHRLVLERHGPSRPLGLGGHASGHCGHGGRGCLPLLCPAVSGAVRAPEDMHGGHRPGPRTSSASAGWPTTAAMSAVPSWRAYGSWTCIPWAGCVGTRSCTSPMPGPASRGLGHRQPFDGGFAPATRRAWPARRWTMRMSCSAGPIHRRRRGCCGTAPTWIWRRNASAASMAPDSRLNLPSARSSNTWASTAAKPACRPQRHFHFNMVFAAHFRVACRPGSRRSDPSAPCPCAISSSTTSMRQYTNAWPLVGRGAKHRPIRGRLPPHPAGTPLAARTPSRAGTDRLLNAVPEPDRHTGSSLKMCPNHRWM